MIAREVRLLAVGLLAFVMLLFIALLVAGREPLFENDSPRDLDRRIEKLSRRPADWLNASAISAAALDAELPQREELWLRSFQLADRLAPERRNPDIAFVRGGLLHWPELAPSSRKLVLERAALLMKEQEFFNRMHRSFWELTRDFDYLRAAAPDSLSALETLRALAIREGLFEQYRTLRRELHAKRLDEFQRQREAGSPTELLRLLPRQLDAEDEPLVVALLEEIERKPFGEGGPGLDAFVAFAVEQELAPLAGLRPVVEVAGKLRDATRARAALAMGDAALATRIEMSTAIQGAPEWMPYFLERALHEAKAGEAVLADGYLARAANVAMNDAVRATAAEVFGILGQPRLAEQYLAQLSGKREWTGTCGTGEVCTSATSRLYGKAGAELTLEADVVQSDRTPPYLEIFLDSQLVAEGEVTGERRFTLPPLQRTGVHRVEVRLVNGAMPGGTQRRVRLS